MHLQVGSAHHFLTTSLKPSGAKAVSCRVGTHGSQPAEGGGSTSVLLVSGLISPYRAACGRRNFGSIGVRLCPCPGGRRHHCLIFVPKFRLVIRQNYGETRSGRACGLPEVCQAERQEPW